MNLTTNRDTPYSGSDCQAVINFIFGFFLVFQNNQTGNADIITFDVIQFGFSQRQIFDIGVRFQDPRRNLIASHPRKRISAIEFSQMAFEKRATEGQGI